MRDERSVPNDNTYKSPEDFLRQMDPVTFEGDPRSEIPKSSRAQLEEVVGILLPARYPPQRNFTVVKDCVPGRAIRNARTHRRLGKLLVESARTHRARA